MSERAALLRTQEEKRWRDVQLPYGHQVDARQPRTDEDLWRSISLDVARGIPELVRMGVAVIVDPALHWDEIVPMPSFARVVVGEQDHLRWKLRLNDERRTARMAVDRIGIRVRQRLGLPW